MRWFEIEDHVRRKLPEKDEMFFLNNDIKSIGGVIQQQIAVYTLCLESQESLTSVANQEQYYLPNDIVLMDKKTAWNLIPDSVRYDDTPLFALNGRPSGTDPFPTGKPTHFYIWQNKIGLWPIPSESGDAIAIRYRRKTSNCMFTVYCDSSLGATACTMSLNTVAATFNITGGSQAGIHSFTYSSNGIIETLINRINTSANGIVAISGDALHEDNQEDIAPTWNGSVVIYSFNKHKTVMIEPELPSEMHNCLIEGILAELYLRDGAAKLFQLHKQLYENDKEMWRRVYGKRNPPPEFHDQTVGGGAFRQRSARDLGTSTY